LNPDIASMAAALLYSLAKNHAFVDGNKRIAAAASIIFLGMNALATEMDPGELADVTLSVADGTLDRNRPAKVARTHIEPVDPMA
jgi:death-on-curing protein